MTKVLAAVAATFAALMASAHADLISTQSQLDALLGSGEINENFSGIKYEGDMTTPPDTWGVLIGPTLNSSTIIPQIGPLPNPHPFSETNPFNNPLDECIPNGPLEPCGFIIEPAQGPGLVVPGVSFAVGPPNPFYDANLAYDPNAAFSTVPGIRNTGTDSLEIDFSVPVNAFGLTLGGYYGAGPAGFMDTIAVYDASDDLLSQTLISFVNGGVIDYFFGDYESTDISKVVIDDNAGNTGLVLADVSFGVVPEPASLISFGTGLLGLLIFVRRNRPIAH